VVVKHRCAATPGVHCGSYTLKRETKLFHKTPSTGDLPRTFTHAAVQLMPSPANGKSFEIDRNAAQVCSRPLAKLSVVNRIDTPLQQCGFILPCSWQREAIA